MRKLFDEIVWQLLMLCIKYLYRYYDILVDGVQLWLEERFPSDEEFEELDKIESFEKE